MRVDQSWQKEGLAQVLALGVGMLCDDLSSRANRQDSSPGEDDSALADRRCVDRGNPCSRQNLFGRCLVAQG